MFTAILDERKGGFFKMPLRAQIGGDRPPTGAGPSGKPRKSLPFASNSGNSGLSRIGGYGDETTNNASPLCFSRLLWRDRIRPTVWGEAVARIVKTIGVFDDFCHANDPHEKHDFGAFDADGHRVFFKIDYLDKTLTYHSPDPTDPSVTKRVITIMLAEEY
jgi:hypothetical protein